MSMLPDLSSGRDQLCNILNTIKGLLRCVTLSAAENDVSVLRLPLGRFHGRLTLFDIPYVFTTEWSEAELKTAELCSLELHAHTADTGFNSLCVACVHGDKLTAERHKLASGTELAKAEIDTLYNCIRRLEVDAVMHNDEFDSVFWAAWSLRNLITASETRASTAELQSHETLSMMSVLW